MDDFVDPFSPDYPKQQQDSLDKITIRKKPVTPDDGVAVFSIMRDEYYFLPHFLNHYRKLGARQIWIYADRCAPDMLAALEAEEDVGIITADFTFGDTFGQREGGMRIRLPDFLKAAFAPNHFRGRWVLIVDADEFFLAPPGFDGLDDFTAALSKSGQHHCFAPMIDFYPRRLAEMENGGLNPFQLCPFFDRGPYHRFSQEGGRPDQRPTGVRHRILAYLAHNHPDDMRNIFSKFRSFGMAQPTNYKVPLIFYDGKTVTDSHWVNQPLNLAHHAALAHFKFYPGLKRKVEVATGEGQYYRASQHYKLLDLAIRKMSDVNLVWPDSVKFQGKKSLVDAGLLAPN
ncbi:MAG: glycosyltransferase family 2 protein [Hyphomicrobiales bacterium]